MGAARRPGWAERGAGGRCRGAGAPHKPAGCGRCPAARRPVGAAPSADGRGVGGAVGAGGSEAPRLGWAFGEGLGSVCDAVCGVKAERGERGVSDAGSPTRDPGAHRWGWVRDVVGELGTWKPGSKTTKWVSENVLLGCYCASVTDTSAPRLPPRHCCDVPLQRWLRVAPSLCARAPRVGSLCCCRWAE